MLDLFSLEGKVAIVTGARTGLGQGIAIGLAKAGADIVGVGHRPMEETKEIIESMGRKFLYIEADLAKQDLIDFIVDKTVETFGKVDILVNNSGIIRRQDVLEFSDENWDDVINVNLKSAFYLSKAVANQFVKQGHGGKILNVASMLSFQGGIRVASYTASKSGIAGITKLMANELAKYNINVNAIAPGYMATNNTEALRNDETRSEEILDRIPAGRWGTPSDLEGAAIYLASKASDYVQATIIPVDGGWLAR
jgi:2-deoxy-D-gluconate 3-dehydrogenase